MRAESPSTPPSTSHIAELPLCGLFGLFIYQHLHLIGRRSVVTFFLQQLRPARVSGTNQVKALKATACRPRRLVGCCLPRVGSGHSQSSKTQKPQPHELTRLPFGLCPPRDFHVVNHFFDFVSAKAKVPVHPAGPPRDHAAPAVSRGTAIPG